MKTPRWVISPVPAAIRSQTIDSRLILLISVTDSIKFWSTVNCDPNMTSLCLSQTASDYNNIKS